MNKYLKSFLSIMTVGTFVPIIGLQAQKVKQQPNVLMFVVDDWGANDLSFSGSKLYETKNVDKLASQSTFFSQGYVAYPRSVPSRYSLITGRHCARPQDGAKSDDRKVENDSYTIAMPFQENGYQTFIIGKWHLNGKTTTPSDKGFDISIGAGKAGSTSSYFAPFNKEDVSNPDKLIYGMEDAADGEYLTDYMARKTVDYVEMASKSDKPFFAICSFYAVHTPIEAKQNTTNKYKNKIEKMGLTKDPMKLEEAGDTKTQQDHPTYAAMIESVDDAIGDVIEALERTGEFDNTIIVLISDHGGLSNRGNKRELATTNLPLKAGKGHLYEGGIRVPYLIHRPGQIKGFVSSVPVVSYDLLPTLVDMCNISVDKNAELDGVSIKELLGDKDKGKSLNRDLFWHKAAQRPTSTGDYVSTAVRSGNYKMIDFYMQNRTELYNLDEDPGENHNIIEQEPAVAAQLMMKIKQWRKEMNVKMANQSTMDHKSK